MTRGSNYGRRLQSATFRGCVACSGSTCNSPSVQFGMHSPPACSLRRRRPPMPACEPTTHLHTLPMSPQYLGAGITSQPFIKQTYDLCILLPPPAIATGCARSLLGVKGVPSEPGSVLRNIPWYLPEVLQIDGTDFIAQVAETCYHPVTNTPGNCISITGHQKPITSYHNPNSLHHSRGHKLFTCLLSCESRTAPFDSSCQASLSACVKNHPRVKDLFEYSL
jgi:hypothetical protein